MDTNQSVAGNLAFRQASVNAINDAVERAIDDLFIKGNIVNPFNDDLAHNYYANLRPGEQPSTGSGGPLWPGAALSRRISDVYQPHGDEGSLGDRADVPGQRAGSRSPTTAIRLASRE